MNSFGNHICDKKHYFLGNKFAIFINHQTFKYLLLEPNSRRIIARRILLLQKYEFTVKGQLRKKLGNVDAILWTYKWVGDHLKNDDFPNAKFLAFDVEKVLKRANCLLDQIFSKGTINNLKGGLPLNLVLTSFLKITIKEKMKYCIEV